MSDKYKIIKGYDYNKPFKYSGKYAELKTTLDNMEDGDCVYVSTHAEVVACINHPKTRGFKGFRVRTRRDKDTGGYYVWNVKREEDNNDDSR